MVKFYAVEFIRNFGRIAYNVSGLGDGGQTEAETFN